MEKLIDIDAYPIRETLDILLMDKTTKQNIIWATGTYSDRKGCRDTDHIEVEQLVGLDRIELQPRIGKAIEEQQARTRKKAEVFTPVWICNQMNNHLDQEWFGRPHVFNIEDGYDWHPVEGPVFFPEGKSWKKYVDSRRLEITCGEAPFLVSRYDAATGGFILPLSRRIGLLDRKLRIVNENTSSYEEWMKWSERAFESCYGFEYQGDNLLIARINFMMTFYDYYIDRWNKDPEQKELRHLAHVVSWNLWQMDGFKDTVPLGRPPEEYHQMSIFEILDEESEPKEKDAPYCRIFNWRTNASVQYAELKKKG